MCKGRANWGRAKGNLNRAIGTNSDGSAGASHWFYAQNINVG